MSYAEVAVQGFSEVRALQHGKERKKYHTMNTYHELNVSFFFPSPSPHFHSFICFT